MAYIAGKRSKRETVEKISNNRHSPPSRCEHRTILSTAIIPRNTIDNTAYRRESYLARFNDGRYNILYSTVFILKSKIFQLIKNIYISNIRYF